MPKSLFLALHIFLLQRVFISPATLLEDFPLFSEGFDYVPLLKSGTYIHVPQCSFWSQNFETK